ILVIIKHRHAQRFRAAVEDSAGGGDVLECSVSAIVKKPAGVAAVGFRRAKGLVVSVEAAENVVFRGPAHIVADEKIEQAVTVVIEPERRGAERLSRAQTTRACHIQESSFAGVVK